MASDVICYICHDKEYRLVSPGPFLRPSHCKCKGTNVLHIECFQKMCDAGVETCPVCRVRWTHLPPLPEKVRYSEIRTDGIRYYVECEKNAADQFDGHYREYVETEHGLPPVLKMEAIYKNGKLDGWCKVYDKWTGRMKRQVFYEEGIKEVIGIYYRNGAVHCHRKFYNGLLHGNSLYFKKNGMYNFIIDYYYGRRMGKI